MWIKVERGINRPQESVRIAPCPNLGRRDHWVAVSCRRIRRRRAGEDLVADGRNRIDVGPRSLCVLWAVLLRCSVARGQVAGLEGRLVSDGHRPGGAKIG